MPKISQLGRCGAVSDSTQAFRVCVVYHSAVLPLKYTDRSHQEGKAHIQSHFPDTLVHRLQRWERSRPMMEAEEQGPLTQFPRQVFCPIPFRQVVRDCRVSQGIVKEGDWVRRTFQPLTLILGCIPPTQASLLSSILLSPQLHRCLSQGGSKTPFPPRPAPPPALALSAPCSRSPTTA